MSLKTVLKTTQEQVQDCPNPNDFQSHVLPIHTDRTRKTVKGTRENTSETVRTPPSHWTIRCTMHDTAVCPSIFKKKPAICHRILLGKRNVM